MVPNPDSALVLFSGGQDSATCLAWALDRFRHVETIGFTYGQRHAVEMSARLDVRRKITDLNPHWAGRLGPDHVHSADGLSEIGATALTADVEIARREDGLPTTFVPGRNLLFLVLAGALATRRETGTLVGGMCETDYSGYPDCRAETLSAQMKALVLGLAAPLALETPLMHLTKAQTWDLAHQLGGDGLVDLIVEYSHTCYLGERERRHTWGYGCGRCPACELRAAGWRDWQAR